MIFMNGNSRHNHLWESTLMAKYMFGYHYYSPNLKCDWCKDSAVYMAGEEQNYRHTTYSTCAKRGMLPWKMEQTFV